VRHLEIAINCNKSCKPESLVKLFGGREVCTWCPDWALECEARRLLKYKSADRAEALMKREEIRGKEATNALRERMTLIKEKK
jgi:hypothetical protein